jgi:hypothetical protein
MFGGRSSRWLWLIVAAAALLRFVPIWFGLPYPHARPDETVSLGGAIAVLSGDPNPHFFHWPSLIFYLFAALHTAASWIKGALAGDALTNIEFVLIARGCVALAGTLTVVVLFRLARRLADPATALLAAAFLAVGTLHVRESHFAMTDVVMTLLVTMALALLIRGLDELPSTESLRSFAASGMTGGLAASTKYSAAAVLASMAAAQILLLAGRPPLTAVRTWLPSAAFLSLFVFGFLVATPYAVLDFEAFAGAIRYDFTHLAGGHAIDVGRGWSYHLRRSLPFGLGPGVFVAGLAGFVPLLRHHARLGVPIAAFAAVLYASLAGGRTVFFRYVLPLVPVLCLTAAVAVRHVASWLVIRVPRTDRHIVIVLAALVALPSFANSVWLDVILSRTDTRVLAAQWLAPQLQPDDTLYDAGQDYTRLQLETGRRWLYDDATNSFGDPGGRVPDWLVLPESPLQAYAYVPEPLRELARSRYRLVWTVRGTVGRRRGIYDEQDAFFVPIAGFSSVRRPGPTIYIYRRMDAR